MKLRKPQYLVFIVSVTVLIGVLFFNYNLLKGQTDLQSAPKDHAPILPDVKIMTVESAQYSAKISGFGESKAHYTLALTTQNSGHIIKIADNFESGCQVSQGTVLAQIDDTDYVAAVADAESTLATAKLALLEEQRAAAQALAEWQGSGLDGEPDSALVLHKPQLSAAKASVVKAEASLNSAKKDLKLTRITAPFNAIVVERSAALGSYLQAGTEVATLYSTDLIEIAVPLSSQDWENLAAPETLSRSNWPVQVTAVEGGQTWQGRVLRAQQHIDETTRQRTLFIAVDSPLNLDDPLLPGTFVEATIGGKTVENMWELHATSLSQKGEIWYLTEDNSLQKFPTHPLFSDGDSIFIKIPEELQTTSARVVIHPLSSYLVGMKVNPVQENDNA